ncbi:MAG: phosphatidate cytidylyltransferase [Bacteroidetes bacterium]|nr:phosphatidate cytidylyltransferase [Bacteroidota bacterium]
MENIINSMGLNLYLILLVYYTIGALLVFKSNKNQEASKRKQNWIKYFSYLLIMTSLFTAILINPVIFQYICVLIIVSGLIEIIRNLIKKREIILGILTIAIYLIISFGFYRFSSLNQNLLFFTLAIVTVFDSFSQLAGQVFGKRKLFPKISPNKTIEGLIGGLIASILTALLVFKLLDLSLFQSLFYGFGIASFAFVGDVLSSFCKRKLNIKDFSNILHGQGGIIDRFDSLMLGAIFMLLITNLNV